jgi:hypothetical protein
LQKVQAWVSAGIQEASATIMSAINNKDVLFILVLLNINQLDRGSIPRRPGFRPARDESCEGTAVSAPYRCGKTGKRSVPASFSLVFQRNL